MVEPLNTFSLDPGRLARLAELRLTLLRFERDSDAAVRRCGLTPRQYLLLLTLEGRHDGAASIGTLSGDLGLAQSTVTELADRSEAKGIVRRSTARHDGRVVLVRTTHDGRRLLARALEALEVDRERLAVTIERIAEALPRDDARHRAERSSAKRASG